MEVEGEAEVAATKFLPELNVHLSNSREVEVEAPTIDCQVFSVSERNM